MDVPVITNDFKQFAKSIRKVTQDDFENGWVAYAKSIGNTDKELLKFLGNVDAQKSSIEDIDTYIQSATTATSKLGATLKSAAINIDISLAISAAVSTLYKLSQVSDEVAQKAANLSANFKNTSTGISSYKEKISELYATINNSSSSLEEVTVARQNLMQVQDELIDKFGTEKHTIDIITDAIYGQSDALDKLTQHHWQDTLNDFNEGSWTNDFSNWIYGYSNNIERMFDEFGNYSVQLNIRDSQGMWNTDEAKKIVRQLQEAGAELTYSIPDDDSTVPILKINGTASEVYEKLLHIQEVFSEENPLSTEHFRNELTKLANSARDVSTQYEDMYNEYVLYERIFKDNTYTASLKKLTDAYKEYQVAFASGDKQSIDAATANFSDVLESATSGLTDKSVIDYFNNMYPGIKSVVDRWEFKAKILPAINTDILKGKTQNDILAMLQTDGLQDGEETFNTILAEAKKFGLINDENANSIQFVLDLLSDWEILQNEIVDKATKNEVIPATTSEMIENINSLSEGFDSLDKIMNRMQDKSPFDYSLLDDKNFKDNFSGLGDVYTAFIDKISNSPKDVAACQGAFNDLVTAWINGSEVLNGLSDETAGVTEAMLANIGITNASEVVATALANSKAEAITASYNLIDAETDEAIAFVNTTMATEEAKKGVARYTLQKITSNGITLMTDGDIENVKSLIAMLDGGVTALNSYNRARQGMLELMQTSPAYKKIKDPTSFLPGQMELEQAVWEKDNLSEIKAKGEEYANSLKAAEAEIKTVLNTPVKYNNNTILTSPVSSSGTKDTKEKAPTTKDFDWISRRQDLLQKLHNQEIEDADDEAKSYETRIALIDDLIAKDNERLEFNKKAAETYTNAWEDAQAKILEEAAKQGEDGHAMIQNIMEGNDANQTITDKADQNLIEAIEAGIDAQDNLNAIQEKSEETNKEITEHLEKQKELKLALVQAQIDIVKAEMDGLDAEIQLMEASGKVVGEKQLKKQIRLSEDLAENYYDRISALEDQLIDADENSAEYHSLMSEIYQCEAAIAECAVQQAEWNDQIKRLPIERINKFLELLGFVKEDLQNFIDQQNALGKTTSLPQFQELININLKQLEQLLDQQGKLAALLNDYEYGSEKYQETSSDLQDIDNEISSLIQSQTEWNKAILQIPLDSITKTNDTLQNAVTAMSDLLSDYDTAISAVTNVLDKQIGSINDLKDAASNEYETKIKPFQDELDLLQKQNDARRIQLDLEQAAYDLARAQEQKTNKVIRDGEITYEADEEAIRSAQNAKNDADYNKVVHDLEAQISGLEEERDKLLDGYDLQIEKLDEIKDRWSSITEEIKLAADSLKADDVLGAGWQDKILSGSDAGIFNSIKDLYTTISDQKNQYEQQITSNERITDMMNQFMESWQNGSITYDQAMAGIKDLAIQMKDGYSSLEHLDALMNLNGATDLGTLLSQMQNSADASVNQFEDYMKVVKENADALEKYNSSWEEMQQNIRDQIAALEKLAKEAEKAADTIERHSSSSGSGGGSKGPNTSDNTYVKNGPGHTEEKLADAIANGKEIREYHKGGVVGGVKTTADLKNDEVFAKLEIGERVITHDQQEAYKATLRQLLEGNYSPAMSVMPMHDMMPVEKYESRPAEVNINMGDITLPNVTNVDEFVHDFGQHIDPMLSQAFSKVFR